MALTSSSIPIVWRMFESGGTPTVVESKSTVTVTVTVTVEIASLSACLGAFHECHDASIAR